MLHRVFVHLGLTVAVAPLLLAAPAHALSKMASTLLCADLPAPTGSPEEGAKALSEAEAAFAGRKDAALAEKGLLAYDKALAAKPEDVATRIKVARLYYLVADGYWRLEGEAKQEQMVAGFEKGMAHAAAAIAVASPTLKKKICSGAPMAEVVAAIDERALEPTYWFATHMGKYGLAKDLLEVLSNKDLIFAMMAKLQSLKPDYYWFAPDRYLGSYYTKVPFPEGDPARSFAHFSASIKGAPQYLATYNLMAELYTVRAAGKVDAKAGKCAIGAKKIEGAAAPKVHPCRTLFESLLRNVINANVDAVPELVAEHAVEKRKAEALLKDIDTFFPAE